MAQHKKRSWWKLALAAVAALALVAVMARPKREPVEAAQVVRGPLRVTVDGEGKTRVRERFTVAAPVSGQMTRVEVRAGDRLDPSTVITRIDPSVTPLLDVRSRAEAEARVLAAQASASRSQAVLAGARAAAKYAATEQARQEKLSASGAGTQAQLDQANLERERRDREVESARMSLQADLFQLQAARAAIIGPGDRAHAAPPGKGAPRRGGSTAVLVRSPLGATVLRVLRESEGPVAAGTALLEVADLSSAQSLEMVVELVSTEAVKVHEGMPALIERWGGTVTIEGKVRRVEPSAFTKISALGVEEQRVNVILDFTPPAPQAGATTLGDGYQAEVRIVTWTAPSLLKVPMGALFRHAEGGRGDGWAVFVIESGKARLRTVTIGHHDGMEAEVLAGLAESDRVILHPGDKIAHGVAVDG